MNPRTTPVRTRWVLTVLFGAAFTMGCAEMLVIGMLDLISVDLAVSIQATGALVTANALGLALGGPLLALLTTRIDRRSIAFGSLAGGVDIDHAGVPSAPLTTRRSTVPRATESVAA